MLVFNTQCLLPAVADTPSTAVPDLRYEEYMMCMTGMAVRLPSTRYRQAGPHGDQTVNLLRTWAWHQHGSSTTTYHRQAAWQRLCCSWNDDLAGCYMSHCQPDGMGGMRAAWSQQ